MKKEDENAERKWLEHHSTQLLNIFSSTYVLFFGNWPFQRFITPITSSLILSLFSSPID
jgi:hypothetical protein